MPIRLPLALFVLLLGLASRAHAGEARWIRYPAVSPDGSQVAFCARGDLWVVPVAGGEARPLTGHVAHERSPVWSPDGRQLAFASDRHGNYDVFVVGVEGGPARRITFHSADDLPSDFTTDGATVLFSSRRLDAPQVALGSTFLPELYAVPVTIGCTLNVILLGYFPESAVPVGFLCMAATFAMRAAAIHWNLELPGWMKTHTKTG